MEPKQLFSLEIFEKDNLCLHINCMDFFPTNQKDMVTLIVCIKLRIDSSQ